MNARDYKLGDQIQYFRHYPGRPSCQVFNAIVLKPLKVKVRIQYRDENGTLIETAVLTEQIQKRPALKIAS